jgi:pimeloyl-ACP methyl ester carboxylesterase
MDLEYETMGSPSDPPVLLVMGFTAQMTAWPDGFCRMIADGGRHVIRFDNRDCGLSSKLDGVEVDLGAVIAAALSEAPIPTVPYTLSDMAADAIGLLDRLEVDTAHIVGASMGGMIAQTMAIEHPDWVRTLTSVMSQPGDPDVGQPTPEAAAALLAPPPPDRQAYIDSSVNWMTWHSRKYRDAERTRADAARSFDRSFYPTGGPSERLAELSVPALVIHGRDDTLITPSGGERTAELIPGAHLLMLADMGHDLPEPLWPLIVGSILAHTA